MPRHRPYSAADTLSRRLRRILFGFCRPIAESYAAKPMGRTSNYLDRRPLPRHGGGVGGRGRCACGYFWSVSVRSTDLDFSTEKNLNSYPALQAIERGLSRGNLSPLTVFWFLLYAQKERHGGEPCRLCLCKRPRPAARRPQTRPQFAQQIPVTLPQ